MFLAVVNHLRASSLRYAFRTSGSFLQLSFANNTRLRDFPSVEKIIGEVCDHGSSAFIRKEMDGLGWVVRIVVPPENPDNHRHFGDSGRDDIMRLTVIATPGEEPRIGLEFTFGEKAQGG